MGNLCGGNKENSRTNLPRKPSASPENNTTNAVEDVRIVFLGTGDSGKSTFFKQVNYMYNGVMLNGSDKKLIENGRTNTTTEYESFISAIYANLLETMQSLVKSMDEYNQQHPDNQLVFKNPSCVEHAQRLRQLETSLRTASKDYSLDMALAIEELWQEDAMQAVFETRYNYHVFDGAPHFFKHSDLKRFRPPDYIPEFNDVLFCRRKTTGVVEARVVFPEIRLLFVDVGGQRSERKKWVQLYGGLEALIFVASLSEFDQKCYEDDTTNRMQESLDLFEDTINNSTFAQMTIILFFNKIDLFEEKLKTKDISIAFPEYTEGQDFEKSKEYIKKKFLDRNKHDPARIFCKFTSATNSELVKETMEMVKNTLLQLREKK
jgi:guanine nucleotide-binding protein G(i) subunit alpha